MVSGAMEAMLSDGLVTIKHTHNGVTTTYGSVSSLTALLETKFFDLDGYTGLQQAVGNFQKQITGVLFEIGEGKLDSVSFYVGVKQRLKDDPTWYGPFSLLHGDDIVYTLDVEDARHFAFRLVDEAPISVWSASAMELYGRLMQGRT